MSDDKSRDDSEQPWLGSTQLVDAPSLQPGAAPAVGVKLVCTKGPNAGREFPLTQVEMVIGRTPENAISLADLSVSRSHARLRRTPAGWAISNLSARYGTLVNGEELQGDEQRLLKDGDVVTVGDSVLLLMEPVHTDESSLDRVRTQEIGIAPPGAPGRAPEGGSAGRTDPNFENRTVMGGELPDPEFLNRTVMGDSAPADPDFENRTVLNGTGPAGDFDVDRTVLGRSNPRLLLPKVNEGAQPTAFQRAVPPNEGAQPTAFQRAVPAAAPMDGTLVNAPTAGLIPLEDRTLVGAGQRGPPSEAEVTDKENPPEASGSGSLDEAQAMLDSMLEGGEPKRPETTRNLQNPLEASGLSTLTVPGPARTPRQIPSRRGLRQEAETRRYRLIVAGLAMLALALGMVPVMLWNLYSAGRAEEALRDKESRGRSEALFQQGQDLLRRGHYAEAKAKLQELRAIDPSYPVQDFITRAEKEASYQTLLHAARAALAKDQLGETREWLTQVPADTAQAEELHRMVGELDSRARARVRDARAALDAQRLDEAIAIAEDVLKVLPDNPDAVSVRADAVARRNGHRRK